MSTIVVYGREKVNVPGDLDYSGIDYIVIFQVLFIDTAPAHKIRTVNNCGCTFCGHNHFRRYLQMHFTIFSHTCIKLHEYYSHSNV